MLALSITPPHTHTHAHLRTLTHTYAHSLKNTLSHTHSLKNTHSLKTLSHTHTHTHTWVARQGPDHFKKRMTGPSKANTLLLLRTENNTIIPVYPIIIMHNNEDWRTNCIQTAVSSLTFCRLPGFNCVLSIILIATWKYKKDRKTFINNLILHI